MAIEGGAKRWIDVELRRRNGRTSVIVNGKQLFTNVPGSALPAGPRGPGDARNHRAQSTMCASIGLCIAGLSRRRSAPLPKDGAPSKANGLSSRAHTVTKHSTDVTVARERLRAAESVRRVRFPRTYAESVRGGRQSGWTGLEQAASTRSCSRPAAKHGSIASATSPERGRRCWAVRFNVSSISGSKWSWTSANAAPMAMYWSITVKLNGLPIFENLQGPEFFPDGAPLGEVGS